MTCERAVRAALLVAVACIATTSPAAVADETQRTSPTFEAAHAALAPAEWLAIRSAIGDQLDALRSGDASRAFSFASPAIRDQFGDASTFLQMVQGSYGALLAARYTEFLDGAVIEGRTIQPLRLVMNDDTVLVALYEMQRDERGGWRIAGCVIAPSTVRST